MHSPSPLKADLIQSLSFDRRDYPKVQMNGWRLWPLAALINYKFIPLQFRVLFVNMVALFWGTFLLLSSKAKSS
jgi:hypothetical protein